MKVLLRFTWASLWKNRARTAVTILGILLSMTLFTAVLAGSASGRSWLAENEIAHCGAWEGYYYGLNSELMERALAQDFIDKTCVWTDVGWAEFPNDNPSKPYLFLQSFDEKSEGLTKIRLKSGRLPENESEILLPVHLKTVGGSDLAEGDTLTLQVGVRRYEENVLSEKNPYDGDPNYPEKITDAVEKTYRVVGIYERLDYDIEGFECPAYTVLTTGTTTDIGLSTLFFTVDSPARFYEETEADKELNLQMRDHSSLLMISGAAKNSSFLKVLNGFTAILIVLIMLGSVSLIYNSFSISISERLKSYGMLRSIGATKRQVRLTVLMESLILCGIGIPLGLGLGLLGIGGVLAFLQKDFSAVFGASLSYVPIRLTFSLPAMLMAVAICLFTTLISALIPAQKAIHSSAIDAIRQTGEVRYKTAKGGALSGKIFGFGGTLAGRNYARSRRKYVITILSLALSLVLFISAAAFSDYLKSYLDVYQADYSGADIVLNEAEGNMEPERIAEEIRSLKHVDDAAMVRAYFTELWVPKEACTEEYLKYEEQFYGHYPVWQGKVPVYGAIQFWDDTVFEAWCRELKLDPAAFTETGAPAGILINHIIQKVYDEQSSSTMRYSTDVLKEGADTVTWYTAARMEGYQFQNVAVSEKGIKVWYLPESALEVIVDEKGEYVREDADFEEDHPECLITAELKAPAASAECPWMSASYDSFSIIYPYSMMEQVLPADGAETDRFYTYYGIMAADHAAAAEEMEKWMDETGLEGGIYDRAEQHETARMALKILVVFSSCFILLMALISAVNVYNTISTNIRLRRREFAILKSVGMGQRDFNKMMRCESLMYVTRSLVLGLALAFLFTYAIFKVVGWNLVTGFYVPWYAVIIAVVLVVGIVFLTAGRAVRQLKGRDLAEELKLENT